MNLSPYDTGHRAEPQLWVRPGDSAIDSFRPAPEPDRYGKVDFDDDGGATIATVYLEKNAGGGYTLHLDDGYDEPVKIARADDEAPAEDEITVTVKLKVTDDDLSNLIECAGYGISYWANRATEDPDAKTYAITFDGDNGTATRVVSYGELRAAIGKLYEADMLPTWFEQELLAGDVCGDAHVGDMIVQQAAFGELVYG